MGGVLTQMFPPKPKYTDKDVPSLAGNVFIVTGGNAGVGLEIVKILYAKGGTVYIASRSAEKIDAEIKALESTAEAGAGTLKRLIIDLADLTTIAACASSFLAQESRLDVLFNNAGISGQPPGSVSAQGEEAHMATNCLGPYLFTKLLMPVLISTARTSPKASVRVVFASSGIIDITGPPGGVSLAELEPGKHSDDQNRKYSASKAGSWFLASEFDKKLTKEGIVCAAQSPGTLKTKGWNRASKLTMFVLSPVMHSPVRGAYTGLWAAFSPEVKCGDGQKFIIPWGRFNNNPNKELLASLKTEEEGGTGLAQKFWDWCEAHSRDYATMPAQ